MRRLEFASLQVRDLEVSKDFYTNKLGFEIAELNYPGAIVFQFNKGEASFAIRKLVGDISAKEFGIGASLWFAIDGTIEQLEQEFTNKHVPVLGSPNSTPFGKTIMIKDPDGYILTFIQTNY